MSKMELNEPLREEVLFMEELLYEACFRLDAFVNALGKEDMRFLDASPKLWSWWLAHKDDDDLAARSLG